MFVSRAQEIENVLQPFFPRDLVPLFRGYDGCLVKDVSDMVGLFTQILESVGRKTDLEMGARHCSSCEWTYSQGYSQVVIMEENKEKNEKQKRLVYVNFWLKRSQSVEWGFTLDSEPNVKSVSENWNDFITAMDKRFAFDLCDFLFPFLSWFFNQPRKIISFDRMECDLEVLYSELKEMRKSVDEKMLNQHLIDYLPILIDGNRTEVVTDTHDFWPGSFERVKEQWRKGVFIAMDNTNMCHSDNWAYEKSTLPERSCGDFWDLWQQKFPLVSNPHQMFSVSKKKSVLEKSVLVMWETYQTANGDPVHLLENGGGIVPYDQVIATQLIYVLPWIFGFDTYGGASEQVSVAAISEMIQKSLRDDCGFQSN